MDIHRFSLRQAALATAFFGLLAGCGGGSPVTLTPQPAGPAPGNLVSASSYSAPAPIQANSKLLVYWMNGFSGKMVQASAVLFTPQGAAPASGWPLVAWVHGTTAVGSGNPVATNCAPSTSPTFDGELTADGFPSHYADLMQSLVGAGYAVVAPDLEGLGPVAGRDGTIYPYYNLSSSGRSVADAVIAAHQAGVSLSKSWASVGHSEGGHVVMALETTATDASAYDYRGTVAFAPFNAIKALVAAQDAFAAADPANLAVYRTVQNIDVGNYATTLSYQQPNFTPDQVMGPDLLALIPAFKSQCVFKVFGDVSQAVATKTPAAFQGFSPQWADNPAMAAFLQANDEAINPGFAVRKPTLVLQGGADVFVPISLQTSFVGRLQAAGMPVVYTTFPTADHGSVVIQGETAMLNFLKAHLP